MPGMYMMQRFLGLNRIRYTDIRLSESKRTHNEVREKDLIPI